MDFRKRIFDKFVRVGAASDPGGTGLGLSICKEMIRAQHGTIWFEESEGGGSRFTFTLPLSDETEEENGNENEGNSDRR
jgi:NtrC-family two-component system sensor histidine kinase KinB